MKKIKYLIFNLAIFFLMLSNVNAKPNYSFNVSSSSIENGSKVTASVTVKNTAAWNIKITSAGNTSGCSNQWVGDSGTGKNTTKTFSVTCRASSVGTISFTLSGDITEEDGSNINVSGSKSTRVIAKKPDSTINTLTSLKVDEYPLTPEFNEDILEYTVSVPPTTTKVNINGTKKDNASKVEGFGEFEVNEGNNKFEIKVTAESGAIRTYIINVNVEDTNPIYVTINDNQYSILKTSRNLEIPPLYTESTITIQNNQVPCFINETTNITLVALKNKDGNIEFFIYDNDNYTKYIEITGNNVIIFPLKEELTIKNWIRKEITINDQPVKGYYYKDLDNGYYLVNGLNLETGEKNIYMYNSHNRTFQIFNSELYEKLLEENNYYIYFLLGSSLIIILCLIIITSQLKSNKKIRKVIIGLESKIETYKKLDNQVSDDKTNKNDKPSSNKKNNKKNQKNNKDNSEEIRQPKIEETGTYNILKDK